MTHPHIDSIGFTTANAEASAGFFAECLGFQRSGEPLLVEGGPYADLVGLPGGRFKLVQLTIGTEVL
ncbi:MAG: lactoylglutathione lyase, partial [Synechococcaceae cyanobacterium ELA182]